MYYLKYQKYKTKYLNLVNEQLGSGNTPAKSVSPKDIRKQQNSDESYLKSIEQVINTLLEKNKVLYNEFIVLNKDKETIKKKIDYIDDITKEMIKKYLESDQKLLENYNNNLLIIKDKNDFKIEQNMRQIRDGENNKEVIQKTQEDIHVLEKQNNDIINQLQIKLNIELDKKILFYKEKEEIKEIKKNNLILKQAVDTYNKDYNVKFTINIKDSKIMDELLKILLY
jgi:hypothetical protein